MESKTKHNWTKTQTRTKVGCLNLQLTCNLLLLLLKHHHHQKKARPEFFFFL